MYTVCVSDALVAEIKRIVKESEILRCARDEQSHWSVCADHMQQRR
jgi:hypothetical protein